MTNFLHLTSNEAMDIEAGFVVLMLFTIVACVLELLFSASEEETEL